MGVRQFIAATFVLLYGIALVRPAWPLLDYYVKMEAYLELCTNRSRPELHCNGQCILMQKIKALYGETQTPAPPAPVKINLQEYPIGFVEMLDPGNIAVGGNEPQAGRTAAFISENFSSEIFHPPSPRS